MSRTASPCRRSRPVPAPDWDCLAALGLPLTALRPTWLRPAPDLLLRQLRRAMATLCGTDAALVPEGREADAVQALLLALHLHFPSFYRRHLARSRLATRLYPAAPTGRQIRLARIATRRLAEYL